MAQYPVLWKKTNRSGSLYTLTGLVPTLATVSISPHLHGTQESIWTLLPYKGSIQSDCSPEETPGSYHKDKTHFHFTLAGEQGDSQWMTVPTLLPQTPKQKQVSGPTHDFRSVSWPSNLEWKMGLTWRNSRLRGALGLCCPKLH